MKILFLSILQMFFLSAAFAAHAGGGGRGGEGHHMDQEQRYMREKEAYRRYDEGGGAYAPGYGGGVYVAPQNTDPAYDSQLDEDMLFDSYHK